MIAAAALLAALLLDLVFGEPPNRFHPVAWLGSLIATLERIAPKEGALRRFVFGAAIAIAVPALAAIAGEAVLSACGSSEAARFLLTAVVLKSTLSVRALDEAADAVAVPLQRADLPSAREALRSLCSRDPSTLDGSQIAAAAIESVAENTSDALVAPVFYFAALGLPGALAYRAVNTLDSMIGYRGRFEWLGKASARLDDLANWIPARLAALALLLAGASLGNDARHGFAMLRRDGGKTESPNAGRPMAAMAGLLRVELEKVGHYRLGDAIEPVTTAKIAKARRIVRTASRLAVLGHAAVLGVLRVA